MRIEGMGVMITLFLYGDYRNGRYKTYQGLFTGSIYLYSQIVVFMRIAMDSLEQKALFYV